MGAHLHIYTGDDDYLCGKAAKEMFDALAAKVADPSSNDVIDGTCNTVAEAQQVVQQTVGALQTLSLFGDSKVVWLRGANFFADSVMGRSESTAEALEHLLDVLGNLEAGGSVQFILSAAPVDRRKRAFKALQKLGKTSGATLKDFKTAAAGSGDDLAANTAMRLGLKLNAAAMEALLSLVGSSPRLIENELEKIATYLKTGETNENNQVDAALVTQLVPTFNEGDFFEISEAFFARDLNWALDAIKRHFFLNKEARGILVTLQGRCRLLVQIRALVDGGALAMPTKKGLPRGALENAAARQGQVFDGAEDKSNLNIFSQNAWYIGNRIAPAAALFTLKELIDMQLGFKRAFQAFINQPTEQQATLENLAVQALS